MNEDYIIPKEINQSDRIGKFTLPQVFILGAGGLISMTLFMMLSWFSIPLIAIVMFMAILFIAKKINEVPLYAFIFVYLVYITTPKIAVYKRGDR